MGMLPLYLGCTWWVNSMLPNWCAVGLWGCWTNGEAKALVVEAFDDCHTVAAGFSGGTIFASAAKAAA